MIFAYEEIFYFIDILGVKENLGIYALMEFIPNDETAHRMMILNWHLIQLLDELENGVRMTLPNPSLT